MEPTTMLIAARPKKTLEEIQAERAKVVAEKKRLQEVKDRQKMNNPTYCENVLNDVRAILDGKGKVNNIDDYKYIEDGVTKYLVGNEPGYDKSYVKSSIASRVKDLLVDIYDLAKNHYKKENPNPKHGSYEGHQHTLDNQKEALTRALGKLTKSCKEYPLTQEQQEVKKRAEQAVKTPTPQEPDPKFRQNSATANESRTLRRVIDKIPFISKEQKDATRKALESAGVPRIIKDSINGGKDYWEKTGKPALKTALDTLVNTGKIAAVIAVFILEFVGKLATGQLVSNPQDTTETPSISSTDKTVNPDSNPSVSTPVAVTSTRTSENKQPISSAPFTSTIPTNQIDSNSESLVPVSETNSAAQNTNQAPVTTAKNLTTQESSQTNLQATSSRGETKEVAEVNNAKLQKILTLMQTRDRSQTSNNITATTSEINQNQGTITTTPNTATASNGKDAAFIINTSQNSVTPSSTALTGISAEGTSQIDRTSTALTGTAAGSSPTALTDTIARGESSKQTQLQQGMAPS